MNYTNLLIEEEHVIRHYQNDIGIPTHSSTRNTQGVEDGDYISQTGIQVYRRIK